MAIVVRAVVLRRCVGQSRRVPVVGAKVGRQMGKSLVEPAQLFTSSQHGSRSVVSDCEIAFSPIAGLAVYSTSTFSIAYHP